MLNTKKPMRYTREWRVKVREGEKRRWAQNGYGIRRGQRYGVVSIGYREPIKNPKHCMDWSCL